MRSAPAVSLRVAAAPHWRAALLGLAALALVSVGTWALQRRDVPGILAFLTVVALAAHCLWRARRRPAMRLSWDGDRWSLARVGQAEPQTGEIAVALDLGAWLLLRFQAGPHSAGRPRQVWLPLQRAGLEADWHALRCALYSPRPKPSAPAAPDTSA